MYLAVSGFQDINHAAILRWLALSMYDKEPLVVFEQCIVWSKHFRPCIGIQRDRKKETQKKYLYNAIVHFSRAHLQLI